MSFRSWVKHALPYPLTCAIARIINRPFLEDIHRNERIVEYAWVLAHVRGPRIADVGCAGSYFAEMLCFFGEVVGIDPRPTPRVRHPRFRRESKVSYGAPYDTVVCISVLEHLPRTAARQLIWQMLEALTSTGQCLVTVPLSPVVQRFKGYQPYTLSEVYDWPGCDTFSVFRREREGYWKMLNADAVDVHDGADATIEAIVEHLPESTEHQVNAVACVRLTKTDASA